MTDAGSPAELSGTDIQIPNQRLQNKDSLPVSINTVLNTIQHDLQGKIPDEALQEVEKSIPTAEYLLEKIYPPQNVLDISKAVNWERSVLSLAIANRWLSTDELTKKKQVAYQLERLFSPTERSYRLIYPRNLHGTGCPPGTVFSLIHTVWPDSKTHADPLEWVLKNVAKDKVATIPTTDNMALLDQVYDELGIPSGPSRRYFNGVASSKRVALVFENIKYLEFTKEHEKAHLDFPGLSIGEFGDFGRGLDEGLTDWTAIKRMRGNPEMILSSDEYYTANAESDFYYRSELTLVRNLTIKNPQLQFLLEDRYEKGDVQAAIRLSSELIKDYGLDKYLRLYLVHDNIRNLREMRRDPTKKSVGEKIGFDSATEVQWDLL